MKTLISVLVILLISMVTAGQSIVTYQALTVADTAVGFSVATLADVGTYGKCFGRLEVADIRFRIDGTDPTATEGVLLQENDIIEIEGLGNLQAFKAIRTGLVSGILRIHCSHE